MEKIDIHYVVKVGNREILKCPTLSIADEEARKFHGALRLFVQIIEITVTTVEVSVYQYGHAKNPL